MLKKAWKTVRENVSAVVAMLSLLGYGTAPALFEDARSAFSDHMGATVLLTALAFTAGAASASFLSARSRWAKKRRKRDYLAGCFAAMPPRRRKMVRTALDEGEVRAWSMDEDALTLCNMGILGMPPIVPKTGEAGFSIQPAVVFLVKEHRAEWLDGPLGS